MAGWREKEVWCEGGAIVLRRENDGSIRRSFRATDGTETILSDSEDRGSEPLPVHVSRGNFPNERPRYVSGLARFTGDKDAYCRSESEVHAKARAQGKVVGRADEMADSHPIHRHNGPWGRGW